MYIIIAKIKNIYKVQGNQFEAFRVIDTDTKRTLIISRERLREAILKGDKVVGLKIIKNSTHLDGKIIISVSLEKGNFQPNKVPEINGKGELVNEKDRALLTVYGHSGFAEAKLYHCFDYAGNERILELPLFEVKVKKGEINGATYNSIKKRIDIDKRLDTEIVRVRTK